MVKEDAAVPHDVVTPTGQIIKSFTNELAARIFAEMIGRSVGVIVKPSKNEEDIHQAPGQP